MERVIFYIIAIAMVTSAIAAVSSRRMLRSVIYLLFVLIGAAGFYFLIDYNFLAAIQLTVYAGGIVVLIIFSVLLISQMDIEMEAVKNSRKIFTAFICLLGLSIFLSTIYSHPFQVIENRVSTTTADIGHKLLSLGEGGFILPFEVISVLLLAAMIGAIVIAKGGKEIRKEPVEKPNLGKFLEEERDVIIPEEAVAEAKNEVPV